MRKTIFIVLAVLVVACTTFGQREGRPTQRRGLGREEQLKAIKAIEEQLAKLKAGLEESLQRQDWGSFRELSDEERTKLRERWAKRREEQQKALEAIEEQIAKLKGQRQLRTEHEESIGQLKAILEQAVKEKAKQTADQLEKLISKRREEFKDILQKLGLDQEPQRFWSRARTATPEAGKKAPEFTLKSFDGKAITLSDYKGKIVVLEWFNDECPFVRYHYEPANTMVELANKYKGKNVVWLAVNSTSHTTPEQNKDFVAKHKLVYPMLDDRPGAVGRAYGATHTPHMFVINARGSIVYEGAIDNSPRGRTPAGQELINYVDKTLAELTAGKAVSMPKTKPYGCTVKYAK